MNRVIPGILLAGLWFFLLTLASPRLFWLVVVAGAGIALFELFRMNKEQLRGAPQLLTLLFALLPVMSSIKGPDTLLMGLLLGFLGLVIMGLVRFEHFGNVQNYLACASLGLVYVGMCAAHLVLLRQLPQGSLWLIFLTGLIAASDTGAYYAGRQWGKRKIFPNISPKKTLAGVVGGVVCGTVVAIGINCFFVKPLPFFVLVSMAILLFIVGIAGDLCESMLKRANGVKDSGTILAGHGGLLDRIDSLLLSAPVLYYLVTCWAAP